MTAMQLYWIIKLDAIRLLLGGFADAGWVIGALAMVVFIVALIIRGACGDSELEEDKRVSAVAASVCKAVCRIVYIAFPLAFIFQIGHTALPSTKEIAAIIVIPKVVAAASESDVLKKIPGKLLNLADDWIVELSPKKTKEGE